MRKVGVEEELLLVDPVTGALANTSRGVLRAFRSTHGDDTDQLEGELLRHMVETHTEPSDDLATVEADLRRARADAIAAGREAGVGVVAVGMAPLVTDEPVPAPVPRYERIVLEYGDTGRTAETLGMHVHVDVCDDEEAVRVVDGIRPWLPLLVAVAANSPYSRGRDTGYASWRQVTWSRWPSAGTSEPFGSVEEYRRVCQALIEVGAALDPGMLYFDARLAQDYPTVEIRVADTCTDIADAVLMASLARALVETASRCDPAPLRSDLLRASYWRAARYGLAGSLVHPLGGELVAAMDAVAALVEYVTPALSEAGDTDLVRDGLTRLKQVGGGARRQRAAFERTGDLAGVVADLLVRSDPKE